MTTVDIPFYSNVFYDIVLYYFYTQVQYISLVEAALTTQSNRANECTIRYINGPTQINERTNSDKLTDQLREMNGPTQINERTN